MSTHIRKAYENLKNNESAKSDNNIKFFLQQIDEIKNQMNKEDNINEGDIKEGSEGKIIEKKLNQGLLDSFNKVDIETILILIDKISEIYNKADLQLDNQPKQDLENLSNILNQILDRKLTKEQKNNIKKLKKLGFNIKAEDIGEIQDLNKQQIENIKMIKNKLGFDINQFEIEEIKDIKLTPEQIKNIRIIKNKLGFDINQFEIEEIKDIKLTPEQIENIKFLKEFGIKNKIQFGITLGDIEGIKDTKLTPDEIENIEFLINELGIDFNRQNLEFIKYIKLTPDETENIKTIKNELGLSIRPGYIEEVKDIKLTSEEIENIKFLKELGIKKLAEDIEEVKDIKLTSEEIENIKCLRELGINYIFSSDIGEMKNIKLTPEQTKNINYLNNKLGISIDRSNIKYIRNNLNILTINNEIFYEGYNYTEEEIASYYNYKRGRIIENIKSYIQNVITEKRNIGQTEITDNIRSDLITLTIKERIEILSSINEIVKKFNTIRKYLNFTDGPYKSPKELLCAIKGINNPQIIKEITDDITVKQNGAGIAFFIGDENSYQIIYDKSLTDSGERTSGCDEPLSNIPRLGGTSFYINGKNLDKKTYGILLHEGQHNRNHYFMPDRVGTIGRAKDEITAFLREGDRGIDEIMEFLTEEHGLYQYELEGTDRGDHKEQVKELIKYANNLIELTNNPNTGLTRDKVISMLSNTPADERKPLHSNIMKAIKNYHSNQHSNYLRWTGTAEKETEINEIHKAKSIDEIKHILNDPKYSHISREPNHKGGIEISAIIDQVVEGKLVTTDIPEEISEKVKELINNK